MGNASIPSSTTAGTFPLCKSTTKIAVYALALTEIGFASSFSGFGYSALDFILHHSSPRLNSEAPLLLPRHQAVLLLDCISSSPTSEVVSQ